MKKTFYFIVFLFSIFYLFHVFSLKQEKTCLKFASWGSQSEVQILNNIIEKYEKEKNVKIEFIHIPQNYFQKIHLLFAANLEPDVLFINNQNIKLYTHANLLENLTPFFPNLQNEFYNSSIDCFSEGDKIFAIPRDISNLVLYVNKDILKQQNIEYKTKISSLQELLEILKQLKTDDYFAINYEYNPLFWTYYLCANGGGILSDNGQELIITEEKSKNGLTFYVDLANKYHIAPTRAEIGSMTTAQMFINGQTAMLLSGRWLVPKFKESISFDWDIIEFPSSKEKKVFIDASGWAISKKSKNKKDAVDFIKYLSSSNSIEEFTKSGLIVPARMDIAKKYFIEDNNKIPQHENIFIDMLQNSKPTPTNRNYNKVNDIIIERTEPLLNGTTNIESAFDEKTIKKIESLLQ